MKWLSAFLVLIPLHSAEANDRQHDCVARAIYWEARGLSENGMRAVSEVVWNRVRHPSFPKTPCGVVYQQRNGVCQFSWVCTNARNVRPPNNAAWQMAQRVAHEPTTNITQGALYFHAKHYRARWRHLTEVAEVEGNVFYTEKQR